MKPESLVIAGRIAFSRSIILLLELQTKFIKVPSVNAIFFNGDRVEGTGNPVIERLSDLERIAEILVSKFGSSINAWVIEASTYNGPFAVYKDFIPPVNSWGEPKSYKAAGFPASTSTVTLLSNCLEEAKKFVSVRQKELYQIGISASCSWQPKTVILGFSKGGTVLNQLVTELGSSEIKSTENPVNVSEQVVNGSLIRVQEENQIMPCSRESFLNSIAEIHYVDVGLNSSGAYLTDHSVIERISKRLEQGGNGIRIVLHGTPRQWRDSRRVLIQKEKDKLVQLLESAAQRSRGKLRVCERFYFADKPPSLQMHFEIIEHLNVS